MLMYKCLGAFQGSLEEIFLSLKYMQPLLLQWVHKTHFIRQQTFCEIHGKIGLLCHCINPFAMEKIMLLIRNKNAFVHLGYI